MRTPKWYKKHENILLKYVASRGGELVVPYQPGDTFATLRCKEGHTWKTRISNLLACKTWCPECAKVIKAQKRKNASWRKLQKMVANRGGTLITTREEYDGTNKKVRIDCGKGHIMDVTASSILQGRWCGLCRTKWKRKTPPKVVERAFKKIGYTLLEPPTKGLKARYKVIDKKGNVKEIWGFWAKERADGMRKKRIRKPAETTQ